MFAHRLFQQMVKFLARRTQGSWLRITVGQTPVGCGTHRAGPPLQPVRGRKFFNSIDQGPRAGHIVERKITIQAGHVQPAVNFGVNEDGFEFGSKENVALTQRKVERFDSHAVAGQNQPVV